MSWPHVLYFATILIALAIMGFLAVYSWRHRRTVGATTVIWIALSGCYQALAEVLFMISQTPERALFWFDTRFLSLAVVPVLWLIFVLEYTGRKNWLSKRLLAGMFVIPVITQVMIWSNSLHGLWLQHNVDFHQSGPFLMANISARIPGPWFMVHSIYDYILLLTGVVLVLIMAWRQARLYRGQAVLLASGASIMVLASLIPTLNLNPGAEFNPLAQSMALGALLIAAAVFRFRFLDMAPIARDLIIDSMDDSMIVLDVFNRIVDINSGMRALLSEAFRLEGRFLPANLVGQPAREILYPLRELAQYFQADSIVQEEITVAVSELERYYGLRIFPLVDWKGELSGRVGFLRNITERTRTEKALRESERQWRNAFGTIAERQRAEGALRESEQRYKQLFEGIGDAVMVYGAQEKFVDCNEATLKRLGYSREELLRLGDTDIVHPDFHQLMKDNQERIWAGEPTMVESAHCCKDGRVIPVEIHARRIEHQGEPAILAVVRDITERKRAEEEIKSLAKFPSENPNPIVRIGGDGNVLYANKAAGLLLPSFAGAVGSPAPALWRDWVTQALASQADQAIDVEHEGRVYAFDVIPITEGGYVNVYARDITERKQAEERLEHLTLVLRAIRNINQFIVREKDRDRLLQGACGHLIETRGYHNAWGTLFDEAGKVVATAEAGLGEEFTPMAERLKRGELTACGRRALTQSEVVIIQDPPSACADCPLAMNYGGREALTIRLEHGGKVYGLLSASIPAHLTANREEQGLFEEVARDIAFALHDIELEEERQRAEEALRERVKELNCLYGISALAERPGISLAEILQGAVELIPPAWQYPEIAGARIVLEDQEFKTANFQETAWMQSHDIVTRGEPVGRAEVCYLVERPTSGEGPFMVEERHLLNAIAEQLSRVFEKMQAEETLRESEQRYRSLFTDAQRQAQELALLDQVRTALARELDLPAVFRTVVEAIANTFGYTQVSLYLLQGDVLVLQHQVGYDHVIAQIPITQGTSGRVARTGEPVLLEDVRADPTFLGAIEGIVSEVCVPLFDQGKVVGTLNVESTDGVKLTEADLRLMTALSEHVSIAIKNARLYDAAQRELAERKQAEETLQKAKEFSESLIASMQDGFSVLDSHSVHIDANPALCQITGFSREELIGAGPPHPYWPPEAYEEVNKAFQKTLRGEFGDVELTFMRKNGERFPVIVSPSWIKDKQGNVIIYFATVKDITERKQAEEMLRESEERYRSLFNGVPVGLYRTTPYGQIMDANPALVQILGYPNRESLLAVKVADGYVDSKEHTRWQALMERAGGIRDFETQWRRYDGTIIWVRDNAQSVCAADGRVLYYEGTAEDITARKQVEEALRESAERFRLAINATEDGLWEWDLQTNREFFASRWCEIIGYSVDDPELLHTYESWASRIHPDDYDRVISAMNNHLEKGTKYDVDYRHRHKSGEYRWQNSKGQAIFDESGKPIKMVGRISDITERKQAEEALRESEEKHRTLFETMARGVVYQTASGEITSANPAAERILGLTLDQMQGRTSVDPRWKAMHEDGSEFLGETHPSMVALHTGKEVRNVVMGVFSPQTDEYRWINIHAVPSFRPGEDAPYQVYTTFEDITERKQAEEQLRASLREKEVLLQEIHHRVKNNLQVVSSLLSLQAEQTKDRQTFEAFRGSQNRIRSMALIHEKLYQSPDLARVDFAEYLQSLATALCRSYGADVRGISLSIQTDKILLGIDTATPCGLLLNELISNALKHAFPAGRAGEIRIEFRVSGDKQCILKVSDNGVGFPQDLEFRTMKSLGLQLVNTLVRQLAGSIKLERAGGTSFEITFTAA